MIKLYFRKKKIKNGLCCVPPLLRHAFAFKIFTGLMQKQLPCHQASRESSPSENLRSHVNTRLMLNDIKAAIRVVSSDDAVLEVTPEVLQALILKHPSEPEDSVTPIIPAENIAVTADENKIIRSLRSFCGGCCGGIDDYVLRISWIS